MQKVIITAAASPRLVIAKALYKGRQKWADQLCSGYNFPIVIGYQPPILP
ncbi:hypothetical protein [Tabrizicola fusiformis]|nr:hypothetical protein [Tabrizicola sp. SY72]